MSYASVCSPAIAKLMESPIRILTVGAVHWREFEIRTPAAWSKAYARTQAFITLGMYEAGWHEGETKLTDMGSDGLFRRWKVSR